MLEQADSRIASFGAFSDLFTFFSTRVLDKSQWLEAEVKMASANSKGRGKSNKRSWKEDEQNI